MQMIKINNIKQEHGDVKDSGKIFDWLAGPRKSSINLSLWN